MRQPVADVYANLREALAALVPMGIAELRGSTFEQRRRHIEGCADLIACKADGMMFSGKKRQPTGVLPAIVRGMAVLAYQPGGVTALGVHACADPHPWCPATSRRPSCCTCDRDACTATDAEGACPDSGGCAWCGNGCPNAEACCSPVHAWGRFVLLGEVDR